MISHCSYLWCFTESACHNAVSTFVWFIRLHFFTLLCGRDTIMIFNPFFFSLSCLLKYISVLRVSDFKATCGISRLNHTQQIRDVFIFLVSIYNSINFERCNCWMLAACAVSSGCKGKNNWHAEHWLYLFWEKSEPAPCWESASSTSGMGGSYIWAWFSKVFAAMCKNMQTSLMNKRSKMALHDKEPKSSKLQNKCCSVKEGSSCYSWNYWQMKSQFTLWALFLHNL